MVQAQDAWVARAIVLRGARKGLLSVFLWRAPDLNGQDVSGYSMAGPQLEGVWYSEGSLNGSSDTIVQSLAASINWTPLQDDGYLVICMRPDSHGQNEIASSSHFKSEVQMAVHSAQNGVSVNRSDYNAP